MALLVLVNGPPASGKSTIADALVAGLLVDQSGDPDVLGTMYDALAELLDQRPHVRRVPVVRGDVDATVALVEEAIRA